MKQLFKLSIYNMLLFVRKCKKSPKSMVSLTKNSTKNKIRYPSGFTSIQADRTYPLTMYLRYQNDFT